MSVFKATLDIIGINPFVFVPEDILYNLFKEAGINKGYIPIRGKVNGKDYKQTLLRYKGEWRLYINTEMLTNSPKRIGETLELSVVFDPADRSLVPHPQLEQALVENEEAKAVFERLAPSKRKEIIRYISFLKTDESRRKNIEKAVGFLLGKNRFIGREKPE
ncbi:YdeI/OmpD-associated family protein [Sphingobacterium prati]|uniref:YdeI/OmpD-associated family protein n=1 Tax=Sphingobacterium prati TaxID=2737006 RepID=UPI001555C0FB|nr:YdeI/OmpD-associated family protein [Sphingobacterium prati]NPE47634.1 YdeI/OmpD-associated family protein [Sphingobacterium prati]